MPYAERFSRVPALPFSTRAEGLTTKATCARWIANPTVRRTDGGAISRPDFG